MKNMKRVTVAVLLAGLMSGPVAANDLSRASAQSSAGVSVLTASVVAGTVSTIANGSQLVVESMETVGESVVYVFKEVSTGVTVSVKTASSIAGEVSVWVGSGITVVADASGHALMASGKVIAFIPNELGKSLIHSKKSAERATEAKL